MQLITERRLEVTKALPSTLKHIGIIMDGNGRWAELRGLSRVEGHRQGSHSVRDIVRASRELGLEALTLYAFSAQNWSRPVEEVLGLMQLLADFLDEQRPEIMSNGIRLQAIGELDKLPSFVQERLFSLMRDSAQHSSMTLCLALSYGGRESLVHAAQRLCERVQRGELQPSQINEQLLTESLETNSLPPLDLVIRTSGEERLSNFLLWESAYAELYFTKTLWPDFNRQDLSSAIESYSQRERRYGLVTPGHLPNAGH
jgi:undecaprenyl diphosphate synthase